MKTQNVLEFCNITKMYPGVVALDDVSLSLRKGEIHALVGENGAGKSTLIKCCAGAETPSSGKMILSGQTFTSFSPITSRNAGISVIYQEFNLIGQMPVFENIFMGRYVSKLGFFYKKTMITRTKEIFDELNVNISPTMLVQNLTVGYQQLVEIAKAIAEDASVLIMDEPSAPLTNQEVETMFKMVRALKKKGVTILYISHRLDEIFSLCDRVTVLRDGKLIKTMNVSDTDREQLISLMVGRALKETFPERSQITEEQASSDRLAENETVLALEALTGNSLSNISFCVKRSEILGLGGLVGAGRTELAELLFGAKKKTSGRIIFNGKEINPKHPMQAIKMGIALVPEDRKRQGILLHMSVRENMSLAIIKKLSKFGLIKKRKEKAIIDEYIRSIHIKTPSVEQIVKNLSGGNQQKVVLAKWLAAESELIVFDEPTRGIDVGAKQEIYLLMDELAQKGKALIMISSDMEELLGMSDRIIILNEGRMTGELRRGEFSQEEVLRCASKNIAGEDSQI